MNLFADNLSMLLKENNISFRKGAQDIGIDRTLLKRYSSGERFPKNEEIVGKITRGLKFDDETSKRLYAYYEIDKKGCKLYMMGRLLERLDSDEVFEIAGYRNYVEEELSDSLISSLETLYMYIDYIMHGVSNVKIVADAGNSELINRIYSHINRDKKCSVEHIVELDGYVSKDNRADYDVFENVIKANGCCRNNTTYYRVRNTSSPISNQMIVTENGVLEFKMFGKGEPLGLYNCRKDVISYYTKRFERIKEESMLYSYSCKNGLDDEFEVIYHGKYLVVGNVENGIVILRKKNGNGIVFCENDVVRSIKKYYA